RCGISIRPCPLWVKSRAHAVTRPCPLYPRKRTSIGATEMSALCQKRTYAVQQTASDGAPYPPMHSQITAGGRLFCRFSNVIASSSFSVGCLSVDCAPSFRIQSVVVMIGFVFIIAFQIA